MKLEKHCESVCHETGFYLQYEGTSVSVSSAQGVLITLDFNQELFLAGSISQYHFSVLTSSAKESTLRIYSLTAFTLLAQLYVSVKQLLYGQLHNPLTLMYYEKQGKSFKLLRVIDGVATLEKLKFIFEKRTIDKPNLISAQLINDHIMVVTNGYLLKWKLSDYPQILSYSDIESITELKPEISQLFFFNSSVIFNDGWQLSDANVLEQYSKVIISAVKLEVQSQFRSSYKNTQLLQQALIGFERYGEHTRQFAFQSLDQADIIKNQYQQHASFTDQQLVIYNQSFDLKCNYDQLRGFTFLVPNVLVAAVRREKTEVVVMYYERQIKVADFTDDSQVEFTFPKPVYAELYDIKPLYVLGNSIFKGSKHLFELSSEIQYFSAHEKILAVFDGSQVIVFTGDQEVCRMDASVVYYMQIYSKYVVLVAEYNSLTALIFAEGLIGKIVQPFGFERFRFHFDGQRLIVFTNKQSLDVDCPIARILKILNMNSQNTEAQWSYEISQTLIQLYSIYSLKTVKTIRSLIKIIIQTEHQISNFNQLDRQSTKFNKFCSLIEQDGDFEELSDFLNGAIEASSLTNERNIYIAITFDTDILLFCSLVLATDQDPNDVAQFLLRKLRLCNESVILATSKMLYRSNLQYLNLGSGPEEELRNIIIVLLRYFGIKLCDESKLLKNQVVENNVKVIESVLKDFGLQLVRFQDVENTVQSSIARLEKVYYVVHVEEPVAKTLFDGGDTFKVLKQGDDDDWDEEDARKKKKVTFKIKSKQGDASQTLKPGVGLPTTINMTEPTKINAPSATLGFQPQATIQPSKTAFDFGGTFQPPKRELSAITSDSVYTNVPEPVMKQTLPQPSALPTSFGPPQKDLSQPDSGKQTVMVTYAIAEPPLKQTTLPSAPQPTTFGPPQAKETIYQPDFGQQQIKSTTSAKSETYEEKVPTIPDTVQQSVSNNTNTKPDPQAIQPFKFVGGFKTVSPPNLKIPYRKAAPLSTVTSSPIARQEVAQFVPAQPQPVKETAPPVAKVEPDVIPPKQDLSAWESPRLDVEGWNAWGDSPKVLGEEPHNFEQPKPQKNYYDVQPEVQPERNIVGDNVAQPGWDSWGGSEHNQYEKAPDQQYQEYYYEQWNENGENNDQVKDPSLLLAFSQAAPTKIDQGFEVTVADETKYKNDVDDIMKMLDW